MNKENKDISPNNELSDIDKAYMAINYPRDMSSVKKALKTIDLDSKTTSAIIKAHEKHDTIEMRRLLATHSLSFLGRRPFLGISQPVVAITRTIRRLPETFHAMLSISTMAVVSNDATNIVQNIPNSPSSSSSSTSPTSPTSPSRFFTLVETGSIVSFNSQTTVSTHVCTDTSQIGSVNRTTNRGKVI
jgi:hypothetical protein